MKHLIMGLLLSLIISNVFACGLDSAGNCNGKAYFKTRVFPNHSVFEFRYFGSTGVIYRDTTQSTGNTDTIISFDQPGPQIQIQFRFKDIDSTDNHFTGWGSYQGNGYTTSALFPYAGCGTLTVSFTNLRAQGLGNNIRVSFQSQNVSNVSHWEIYVSDIKGIDWDKVGSNIEPIPNKINYDSGVLGLSTLAFGILLISSSLKSLRQRLKLILIWAIIGFACTKNVTMTKKDYKLVKLVEVTKDGGRQSGISPIN